MYIVYAVILLDSLLMRHSGTVAISNATPTIVDHRENLIKFYGLTHIMREKKKNPPRRRREAKSTVVYRWASQQLLKLFSEDLYDEIPSWRRQ